MCASNKKMERLMSFPKCGLLSLYIYEKNPAWNKDDVEIFIYFPYLVIWVTPSYVHVWINLAQTNTHKRQNSVFIQSE